MAKIVQMKVVDSIKVGRGSTVLPDGTIIDPVPYHAVDIVFDCECRIQLERPLTEEAVTAAWKLVHYPPTVTIDGISTGFTIVET